MLASNRRILACILFLGIASLVHAQSGLAKDETATVSGKVTLKKKPLAGVVVFAVDSNDDKGLQRQRTTTDEEGNYRISSLTTGTYYVFPMASAFVVEDGPAKQQLVLAPGDTVRDIDFALVKGGVITGRITGADGQPLIGENVNVIPLSQQFEFSSPDLAGVRTDDRGIYRAFGLRSGKYRVAVGKTDRVLPGQWSRIYRQTFYPSVTELDKATILDVSEGGEIRGIDIVMGPPVSTFKATGRIIDGETGKPLRDVILTVGRMEGNVLINSVGATGSDTRGEFKVENLLPGKYSIFPFSDTSNWRAEPLRFEIADRDVTGLEIKTTQGVSVSGVVVMKNYDEKLVAATLEGFEVFAFVDNPVTQYSGGRSARLAPDGSFKIVGLAPGNTRLALGRTQHGESRQFRTLGIERNGVPLSSVELKSGDQVDGIRIIVKSTSFDGVIRGQIKFENGEPPPGARIYVSVAPVDEVPADLNLNMPVSSPPVDSRGRFMVDHLSGGTYEVSATLYQPNERSTFEVTKQEVMVTSGAVSEVTITIKLKP